MFTKTLIKVPTLILIFMVALTAFSLNTFAMGDKPKEENKTQKEIMLEEDNNPSLDAKYWKEPEVNRHGETIFYEYNANGEKVKNYVNYNKGIAKVSGVQLHKKLNMDDVPSNYVRYKSKYEKIFNNKEELASGAIRVLFGPKYGDNYGVLLPKELFPTADGYPVYFHCRNHNSKTIKNYCHTRYYIRKNLLASYADHERLGVSYNHNTLIESDSRRRKDITKFLENHSEFY